MNLQGEKLDQAARLVAEGGLDVWLTFVRETAHGSDPVLPLILEGGLTWQSALLVFRDSPENLAQFVSAPPLGNIRMNGRKVNAENPRFGVLEFQLQVMPLRKPRPVPRKLRYCDAAHKGQRVPPRTMPLRHSAGVGDGFDNIRANRLLENDNIGIAGANDARDFLLTALAAHPDVVTEQAEVHGCPTAPNSTR